MTEALTLTVRRTIRAPAARVFEAWTEAEHLRKWWGPEGVACPEAHLDLRVGGEYRIANQLPDGGMIWIFGAFEVVEPPHLLVYTWSTDPGGSEPERVTVRFEPDGDATAVVVTHERIDSPTKRDQHEHGWQGCLSGLAEHLGSA